MKKRIFSILLCLTLVLPLLPTTALAETGTGNVLTFTNAYDVQRSPDAPSKGGTVKLTGLQNPKKSSYSDTVDPAGSWTLTCVGTFASYTGKPTTDDSALQVYADIIKNVYGTTDVNEVPIYELKLNGTRVAFGVVQAQGKVYDNENLTGEAKDNSGVLFVSALGFGYYLTSESSLLDATPAVERYIKANVDGRNTLTFGYAYDASRNNSYPAVGTTVQLYQFGNPYKDKNSTASTANGIWTLTPVGKYSVLKDTTLANYDGKDQLASIVSGVKSALNMGDSDDLDIYQLKLGNDVIVYGVLMAEGKVYDKETGGDVKDEHGVLFYGAFNNSHSGGTGYFLTSEGGLTSTSTRYMTVGRDASGATHTHSYTEETVKPEALKSAATCTSAAVYYKSCTCGEISTSDHDTFTSGTANGHTPGSEWKYDSTNHWHVCTVTGCGAVIDSTKTAHTAGDWEVKTPATAANNGVKVKKCTVCGYEMETATIPKIAASRPLHDVNVADALNGAVAANHDEAREGTIVTVTVSPDNGYALDSLTVTDANGNTIQVTHVGGNKYTFIMPDSKVTVRAMFTDGTNTGFVDVPAGKYFYNAVNWAVAGGITGGVDGTHFAPYASCTRGQLVTFLWRAAGQPKAKTTENPFSDVKNGAFYQAILWAAENGIVTGYSDGTFRPNASVTRQQTAAILYRYAAYAKMDISVGEDTNILSFNDALSVSEYAIPAIQWAVGEGVMQGDNGNILPGNTCTRAQIVTMLYRLLAK